MIKNMKTMLKERYDERFEFYKGRHQEKIDRGSQLYQDLIIQKEIDVFDRRWSHNCELEVSSVFYELYRVNKYAHWLGDEPHERPFYVYGYDKNKNLIFEQKVGRNKKDVYSSFLSYDDKQLLRSVIFFNETFKKSKPAYEKIFEIENELIFVWYLKEKYEPYLRLFYYENNALKYISESDFIKKYTSEYDFL